MDLLIAWYSRTGTTLSLVPAARRALAARGHRVAGARLRPRRDLPYPLWLLWSAVPGARVPLRSPPPDPRPYGGCVLMLPKWTLSCPPVNAFLARVGPRLPPTALVLTCGGWDQERFAAALTRRLADLGAAPRGSLTLRRRAVERGEAEAPLAAFLAEAFP